MQHRSEIYADPTLQEVNDHGSDRIRAKLEKMLGEVAVQHGLGKEVVKDAKGGGGGVGAGVQGLKRVRKEVKAGGSVIGESGKKKTKVEHKPDIDSKVGH